MSKYLVADPPPSPPGDRPRRRPDPPPAARSGWRTALAYVLGVLLVLVGLAFGFVAYRVFHDHQPMPRTHHLPDRQVHFTWDTGNEPVLDVGSGDTVVVWTRDVSDNQIGPNSDTSVIAGLDWLIDNSPGIAARRRRSFIGRDRGQITFGRQERILSARGRQQGRTERARALKRRSYE